MTIQKPITQTEPASEEEYELYLQYSKLLNIEDDQRYRGFGLHVLLLQMDELARPELMDAIEDVRQALNVLTCTLVDRIGDATFWASQFESLSHKERGQDNAHLTAYLIAKRMAEHRLKGVANPPVPIVASLSMAIQ